MHFTPPLLLLTQITFSFSICSGVFFSSLAADDVNTAPSSRQYPSEMIFIDTSEESDISEEREEPRPIPPKASAPPVVQTEKKAQIQKREFSEDQCVLPQMGSVSLGHIEGKGIGYGLGYTTLEGFVIYPFAILEKKLMHFLDLRAHLFDDGKFAANVGFGARLPHKHIHTVGIYYDYRQTHRYHFNQLSLDYENLGKKFDWRVNGYFPVGNPHGPLHDGKKEYALWGFNGEAGMDLYHHLLIDCYGAIGPYYFGRSGINAWGVQARTAALFEKYIKLELNGSYDTLFKWIGQVQLSIFVPFGPLPKRTASKEWCNKDPIMKKIAQRVDRFEIIVVDNH